MCYYVYTNVGLLSQDSFQPHCMCDGDVMDWK